MLFRSRMTRYDVTISASTSAAPPAKSTLRSIQPAGKKIANWRGSEHAGHVQLVLGRGVPERLLVADVDPRHDAHVGGQRDPQALLPVGRVQQRRAPRRPQGADDEVVAQRVGGALEDFLAGAEVLHAERARHRHRADAENPV